MLSLSATAAGAVQTAAPAIAAAAKSTRIMSHPWVVMTGWSSRSLTGAVWVVNVFLERTARRVGSLHDDIERDVESLVGPFDADDHRRDADRAHDPRHREARPLGCGLLENAFTR